MSTVRSPRQARWVLAFTMGIAGIFDLTGTTVYQTMRGVLPPAPPPADDSGDPFRAAMGTIISSHHDAMVTSRHDAIVTSHDESGVALPP